MSYKDTASKWLDIHIGGHTDAQLTELEYLMESCRADRSPEQVEGIDALRATIDDLEAKRQRYRTENDKLGKENLRLRGERDEARKSCKGALLVKEAVRHERNAAESRVAVLEGIIRRKLATLSKSRETHNQAYRAVKELAEDCALSPEPEPTVSKLDIVAIEITDGSEARLAAALADEPRPMCFDRKTIIADPEEPGQEAECNPDGKLAAPCGTCGGSREIVERATVGLRTKPCTACTPQESQDE